FPQAIGLEIPCDWPQAIGCPRPPHILPKASIADSHSGGAVDSTISSPHLSVRDALIGKRLSLDLTFPIGFDCGLKLQSFASCGEGKPSY
ncbi:hypothetical protein Tco_0136306, partial [Tanacetum coccineum]